MQKDEYLVPQELLEQENDDVFEEDLKVCLMFLPFQKKRK